VLALLKDKERADVLLLRLAMAAKVTGAPRPGSWADALGARFDAARLRGDACTRRRRRASRWPCRAQPKRALPLASANYALQREPADARVLLEAAVAAREPAAAAGAALARRDRHRERRAAPLAAQLKGKS
jgi:hypothetical protein